MAQLWLAAQRLHAHVDARPDPFDIRGHHDRGQARRRPAFALLDALPQPFLDRVACGDHGFADISAVPCEQRFASLACLALDAEQFGLLVQQTGQPDVAVGEGGIDMADDKSKRDSRDRDRVSADDDYEFSISPRRSGSRPSR